MTDPNRALLIKKLLNKAEANGVTPEESDLFNAKAAELMLKWGIEEAMLVDADRVKVENIVQREFATDVPKSYSYEVTCIGIEVAKAFGCQGLLQRKSDRRTNLMVVGFESDVERVHEMFRSLSLQATFQLATWFSATSAMFDYWSGTDKYNAKRSFLQGYASGVRTKLRVIKTQVIKESAPGTDLVLVDRATKVTEYIENQMKVGSSRGRRYTPSGHNAGHDAGKNADLGTSKIGG